MFTVNRYANKKNKIVRLLIAKERRTFRFWNVPFKAKGLLSTKAFVNLLLFPFIQDATNDAYVRRHMKPELEEKRRKRLVIIFIVIIFSSSSSLKTLFFNQIWITLKIETWDGDWRLVINCRGNLFLLWRQCTHALSRGGEGGG